MSIVDVIIWLVKMLEGRGTTDRAKLERAYEQVGRVLSVVQGAYDELGKALGK